MCEHLHSAFRQLKVMLPCRVVPSIFGVGLYPRRSRFGCSLTIHSRDLGRQDWGSWEAHCKPAFLCTKTDCFSLLRSPEPNISFPHTPEADRPLSLTSMASRFPLPGNYHCTHSSLVAMNSILHQWGTAWKERLLFDVFLFIYFT